MVLPLYYQGVRHFCVSLYVTMQSGLYHHPVAEGIPSSLYTFHSGLARY